MWTLEGVEWRWPPEALRGRQTCRQERVGSGTGSAGAWLVTACRQRTTDLGRLHQIRFDLDSSARHHTAILWIAHCLKQRLAKWRRLADYLPTWHQSQSVAHPAPHHSHR